VVGARARRETAHIDPRKPWQNATDKSFNGTFRDELSTLHWFRHRAKARVAIEEWRRHYNDVRPHWSLGYLTPAEFKALPPHGGPRRRGRRGGFRPGAGFGLTQLTTALTAGVSHPGRVSCTVARFLKTRVCH